MPDALASSVDLKPVLASYARCRGDEDFVPRLYRRLWQRAPAVRAHFAATDMQRQHGVMREAIMTLLLFARRKVVARLALDRIGRLHARSRHDVHPELYAAFSDALIETLAERDPEWTPALGEAWREAISPGLAYMAALYAL